MKIKKGDTVKILYGKDAGKKGNVVALDLKNEKIIVEGINLYKRHLKGDGRTRTSEILVVERPLPVSKVMVVCPNCDKPSRFTVVKDEKANKRVCKKCGKEFAKKEVKEVKKKESKSTKKKVSK